MPVYQPLADNVVVKLDVPAEVSDGGIIKPEIAREIGREATVVGVGPGRFTEIGKRIEPQVRIGDRVLIYKHRGTDIEHKGDRCRVLREQDLICTVGE